jgi:DNA-directed RNA polymerase specialized sigma24 family protein
LNTTFDSAWRQRALRGDAAAVQGLVDEALEPLYAFCLYRVGRNRHLCEEVVQETLFRALRDLANYDPQRSSNNIFSWLTGLARNEIHRTLGRQHGVVSLEALWANVNRQWQQRFQWMQTEAKRKLEQR